MPASSRFKSSASTASSGVGKSWGRFMSSGIKMFGSGSNGSSGAGNNLKAADNENEAYKELSSR